jgi:hypothetical protein
MNCYHKFLQKNVYRTCAGNCDEIASVTTFHRNDKNRGQEPRQVQNCHGEESCKTTRPSVSKQIASVTTFHRNDKNSGQVGCE